MELITKTLELVYIYVGKEVLLFISKLPNYLSLFIVFIVIVVIGYIIAKFTIFILRPILYIIKVDEKTVKIYKNLFFGYSTSSIILNLVKYYILLYFVIKGASLFNLDTSYYHILLNNFYILIISIILGIGLGGLVEYIILKENSSEKRKTLSKIARGLFIYLLFLFGLSYAGFNYEIFLDSLKYFLVSMAISFGIVIGVLLGIEHKEDILKILK